MCHKSAPAKTVIKEETIASLKRARKTRSKTRKPKFLSLNQELSPQNMIMAQHKQLNLFPLHPVNLVEDVNKDHMHDENDVASYLLDSDSGGTLTGLLDGCDTSATRVSSEEDSLTYGYRGQESSDASNSLVRTAMRSRERELKEEKWVCYSEVMVEKKVEEEVSSSSCAVDGRCSENRTAERGLLALKLDYQEILNAWSDKGPLYVDGESPQTVPDLHDTYDSPNVLMDRWGNGENGGLWRVPEVEGKDERWKMGQREASVMRYKEKRQNRLFSKRIRYQVRKLNAEKRPRIKGRFVKI